MFLLLCIVFHSLISMNLKGQRDTFVCIQFVSGRIITTMRVLACIQNIFGNKESMIEIVKLLYHLYIFDLENCPT